MQLIAEHKVTERDWFLACWITVCVSRTTEQIAILDFSLLFHQENKIAEGSCSWLRKQSNIFQVSYTTVVEEEAMTNKGAFS